MWYCLFIEQGELTKFALMFSEQQDIVKSELWLNLIPENGIAGGTQTPEVYARQSARMMGNKLGLGRKPTPESLIKMMGNKFGLGYKDTPEACARKSARMMKNTYALGRKHTAEQNIAKSVRMMGKKNAKRKDIKNAN